MPHIPTPTKWLKSMYQNFPISYEKLEVSNLLEQCNAECLLIWIMQSPALNYQQHIWKLNAKRVYFSMHEDLTSKVSTANEQTINWTSYL